MKRDMDIVRRITLATSDMEHNHVLTGLDGLDKASFSIHGIWMQEAGLVVANVQEYRSGEPATVLIRRLTWEGCDFADAVRSDTLWKKAKEVVILPTASFTFGMLKD